MSEPRAKRSRLIAEGQAVRVLQSTSIRTEATLLLRLTEIPGKLLPLMMRSSRVLFLFGGQFAGVHVMSERIGGDESPSASRNRSLFPMRKDLHSGLWNEHAQLPEKRKVTRRAPRKASIVSYLLTSDLATSDSEHEELKLDEEDSTEHSMEDDNEHSRSENQEPTGTIEGFNKPFEVPDGLEVQEKDINVDYAFLENLVNDD